jgi:hypothetical protein
MKKDMLSKSEPVIVSCTVTKRAKKKEEAGELLYRPKKAGIWFPCIYLLEVI